MGSYIVRITEQARDYLRSIHNYIADDLCAPQAAHNTIVSIRKSIESLSWMPDRYRLVDEKPWDKLGIHKLIVKNYIVYYWIDETEMKVQIIAVIYASRDQETQLNKLDTND